MPNTQPQTLSSYIDSLIERLRELIPGAIERSEVDAIHQARVSTRRIKACLDLVKDHVSQEHLKPLAKTLRRLRRTLGPLRDLDVMLGHLRTLNRGGGMREPIEWLTDQMSQMREKSAGEAREDVKPSAALVKLGQWWGLREQVRQIEGDASKILARSLETQLRGFAAGADALVENSEKPAEHRVNVDAHQIRIDGKLLRYTLETSAATGHELEGKVFKTFKRMQESLGLWHDYVVLTEQSLAISTRELLAHHNAELQRKILTLAQQTLRKSTTHLSQFARQWKSSGGAVRSSIALAFSLDDSVTGSGTGRDLLRSGESRAPAEDPPDAASVP